MRLKSIGPVLAGVPGAGKATERAADRKSTRLNSSHSQISYAVFCLKKKKNSYKTKHHDHPKSTTLNEGANKRRRRENRSATTSGSNTTILGSTPTTLAARTGHARAA